MRGRPFWVAAVSCVLANHRATWRRESTPSLVGYLGGPRLGAIVYNVAHDLATGVAIAGAGLAVGSVAVAAIGAILVAHSGMDRMAGYGLKLPGAFRDTHLGRIGRGR